jgi:hypothetical protein
MHDATGNPRAPGALDETVTTSKGDVMAGL